MLDIFLSNEREIKVENFSLNDIKFDKINF